MESHCEKENLPTNKRIDCKVSVSQPVSETAWNGQLWLIIGSGIKSWLKSYELVDT